MTHDPIRTFAWLACLALATPAAAQSLVSDIKPGLIQESGLLTSGKIFATSGGLFFDAIHASPTGLGRQLFVWDGLAAQPTLIWESSQYSSPLLRGLVELPNGLVLFGAEDSYGSELHVSDGTAAGTSLLVELRPGAASGFYRFLGAFGNRVFFTGDDGVHGQELWITDGTVAGTVRLTDIAPGAASSLLDEGVVFQGRFFFPANDNYLGGGELWVSDGTPSGTSQFVDLDPAQGDRVESLTVLGPNLLFSAYRFGQGQELFRSDGTPAGTDIVVDLYGGGFSALPEELTVIGSSCYFAAKKGPWGRELWKTDGSAITLVKDIQPGSSDSDPEDFVVVGSEVMFSADDGVHGRELWRTDGTTAGTALVADITVGSAGTVFDYFDIGNIGVALGSSLVFPAAVANGTGQQEPWVSDGTAAGTTLLRDIYPGSFGSGPGSLVAYQGAVYFRARDAVVGRELWVTDGTSAGTTLALDLAGPRPASSQIRELTALGDKVVFSAEDGVNGVEPWVSDGSSAGTSLLLDLSVGGDSTPREFTELNGRLYFTAEGSLGRELYTTDGTSAGTSLVKDIYAGAFGSGAQWLTVWNGEIYFAAQAVASPRGLWKTDGTAAGTVLIAPMTILGSGGPPIMALANRLLILANRDLYTSDGTTAGTMLVDAIDPVTVWNRNASLVVGDFGYFFGERNGEWELFRSDGTAAGIEHVYRFDDTIFRNNPSSYELLAFDGQLLIQAKHSMSGGGYGRELFLSDGTTAGTTLLKDIIPGPTTGSAAFGYGGEGDPQSLTVASDRVMFSAKEDATGRELWITDGTTAGTVPVVDLAPGTAPSVVSAIYQAGVGRRVIFSASDATSGRELWVSDGSASGTQRLTDLWPGAGSGLRVTNLAIAGDQVFFVGNDGTTGEELFVLPLSLVEATGVEFFGSGCAGSNGVPAINYAGVPAIGNSAFAVEVSNAVAGLPVLLVAADSRTDTPFPGGCTLYPTAPVIAVSSNADGSGDGSIAVPVPTSVALIGAELFLQWLTVDPAGPFLNLAATSRGMRIQIGRS